MHSGLHQALLGFLCPGVCLGWGGRPENCIVLEQVKDLGLFS